jgi:DNA repair exonuclease SbcCD nuclease subunit
MVSFLVIGDIHFKVDNVEESFQFIDKLDSYIKANNGKFNSIIILGDVLHTHEKVHTQALNVALDFFKMLSSYKVYVLVGNHDMTTNTNFLNNLHWMNCLKEWNNIVVIDTIYQMNLEGYPSLNDFILLSPYVPDGRFVEALSSIKSNWKDSKLIFGHQLLNGAKMGAIIAENIEEWKDDYPMCISGHIHSKQWVKSNLFYTGSCRQIAFGETDDKSIYLVKIEDNYKIELEEINLELPIKKILYFDANEIESKLNTIQIKKNESIKLVITGDEDFFKEYKKTEKLKKLLLQKGIEKVIFKKKCIENIHKDFEQKDNDFLVLLDYMVKEQDDEELYNLYKNVIETK